MSVDLSALNLTELVNGMLIRALKVSNLKTVDPAKFPTRYCYCLNNRTNDLSDFTALLVDIVGNSTSYLTEIFKSTSILSVSQANESDCIFICVMSGKSGRNLSDFWEMAEKSPVINYTFTSSMSATRGTALTSQLTPASQQTLPRTSPPRGSQNAGVSALRSSPWTESTPPSEGEQTMSTNKRPEGHSRAPARATATLDSASPTLPAWVTRKVAGTPWVTAHRQAWASTLPVPWAQATSEKTPGGLPWETLSSPPTSPAEAEEAMNMRSFSETPAKTAATPGSPSGTSPTSGPFTPGTQTPSPTKAPAPRYPQTGDLPAAWPFTPGEEPALVPGPHQKLNPCLMELCRFFQQCLCMSQKRDPRMEAAR
eukprot:bmy_20613T0